LPPEAGGEQEGGRRKMPRIPAVNRADLDAAGQAAWDGIEAGRHKVQGPFSVLLHSPELSARISHLGSYVRYECGLPNRWRHLVTMIGARSLDCQYEFTVHAGLAAEEGIPRAVVDAIDHGTRPDPELLQGVEPTLVEFAHQLINDHRVDDATFARLKEAIGLRELADVVGTIGYFAMIAHALNAFDVEVRAEHSPQLTIPRPEPPAVSRAISDAR
jgi:4-carboxymuconolactone decarboxylase